MVGIPSQFEVGKNRFHGSWCFPIFLMTSIANGDMVTNFTPGFAGVIKKWYWIQGAAVTTIAKLATLNLEVNAVNLTGGTISLTSAACTPLGKVIDCSTITGGNSFDKDDTISIEAASVTAFIEGSGFIIVEYEGKILR